MKSAVRRGIVALEQGGRASLQREAVLALGLGACIVIADLQT